MSQIAGEKENGNGVTMGVTANPLLNVLLSNSAKKNALFPAAAPVGLKTGFAPSVVPQDASLDAKEVLKQVTNSDENTNTNANETTMTVATPTFASPSKGSPARRKQTASPRASRTKSPRHFRGGVGPLGMLGSSIAKMESDAAQTRRIRDLEKTVEELRGEVRTLEGQREEMRRQMEEKDVQLEERATQLRQLIEENTNMQGALSEKQADLSEVLLRRESLQSHMNQTRDNNKNLEKSLKRMKKEFFFSTAIAIKLSYSNTGNHCNINARDMWEVAQREQIAFSQYPSWIAEFIAAENLKSRR